MRRNFTEWCPLQDQYGGGGGGGHPIQAGGRISGRVVNDNRNKGRILFQVDQEINNLDSVEVFRTAEISALADRRAVVEAPKKIEIKNTGQAGLGIILKVPIWTGDGVQSGSNYIQMLLGAGERLELPTSQMVDSVDEGLNTGTEVTAFTTPSTNLYIDSTADTDDTTATDNVDNSTTNTTVYLEPYTSAGNCTANMFRIGDLIRIRDEIMEVTDIGTKANLANNTLTVKRGLYGSTATSNTDDDDPVRFAFFNTTRKFDKYSSTCTDENGLFRSSNFFGLGRGLTVASSGIVPGSVTFNFYSEPYQEMGCTDLTEASESGLTSGEIYYVKVAVNGGTAYEVVFTVDSTKMGGANGVLSKIQTVLDAQYYTTGSALNNKKVSVGLVGGDVRWRFHERKVGSTIALTAGTTGDTSHDMIANALGVFPASVEVAVTTSLPNPVLFDSKTYQERPNTSALLYDNGLGQLVGGAGSGSINYETGAISINSYSNADIVYVVSHTSGLAGRASSTKANIIENIYAKSTNAKVNSRIKLTVRG